MVVLDPKFPGALSKPLIKMDYGQSGGKESVEHIGDQANSRPWTRSATSNTSTRFAVAIAVFPSLRIVRTISCAGPPTTYAIKA